MENQSNLTLGSLFSGSGGFELGGMIAGITPKWASEIEPFPVRVTTKRMPDVKHYGDVTTLDGAELPPVDIITFGSPCQDMSVAGKRAGLNGPRSNLFYEAVRIVKEMRCKTNGRYPRYIVWENVPGAFSSDKGKDFRAVLEEICKIKDESVSVPVPSKWQNAGKIMGDDYSVAWRVLDAQFWGVPQRRKRIYLVADFNGWSADKVLFESEGLSGYSAESFTAWKETAGSAGKGSLKTGGFCIDGCTEKNGVMFENHGQDCRYTGPLEVSQTVLSTFGTGGNNQPFVVEPTAFGICSRDSNAMKSDNPDSGFYEAETARTLDLNGGNPACNQGGIAVVEGNGTRPSHHGDGYKESDVMYTLNATEQHGVAYGIGRPAMNQGYNSGFSFQVEEEVEPTLVAAGAGGVAHPAYTMTTGSFMQINEEKSPTLAARDYKDPPVVNDRPSYGFYPQMKAECVTFTEEKSGCLVNGTNPGYQNGVVEQDYIVRRLTPAECARLQGFPDRWCDDLGEDNPSDEEIEKWREIFLTYAKATGKSLKPKTDAQIRKWLKNPYSDSAAYKMWGNGVALPCVFFVLSGISYYAQQSEQKVV